MWQHCIVLRSARHRAKSRFLYLRARNLESGQRNWLTSKSSKPSYRCSITSMPISKHWTHTLAIQQRRWWWHEYGRRYWLCLRPSLSPHSRIYRAIWNPWATRRWILCLNGWRYVGTLQKYCSVNLKVHYSFYETISTLEVKDPFHWRFSRTRNTVTWSQSDCIMTGIRTSYCWIYLRGN